MFCLDVPKTCLEGAWKVIRFCGVADTKLHVAVISKMLEGNEIIVWIFCTLIIEADFYKSTITALNVIDARENRIMALKTKKKKM